MKAARILRQKINSDTVTTGVIVSYHLWPALVEISINSGLDYLIIDCEHGSFSPELICDVCAIGRLMDFAVLIRPIDHAMSTIRKAIDMGPCGMLLPTVESAEALDQVRDAVYMPPRGRRRPGGRGLRWVLDYTYSTWKTEIEDDLIVLPQIETRKGLQNLETIAAHEITTAMAIGPYDLSAELGVCGDTAGPKVSEAAQQIQRAAKAAGKGMWILGDGPELIRQGFSFLCIAEPTGLLEATLREQVSRLQDKGNPSKPAESPYQA
jgi:2-keto-3-deoxy-L-rhamnonate aldolase RhmA